MATTNERKKLSCTLYISSTPSSSTSQINHLSRSNLRKAIVQSQPEDEWNIYQTSCGLAVTFYLENDADKFIRSSNLSETFQCPVQVIKFRMTDSSQQRSVYLRKVPWTIPLQDLSSALCKQGITSTILVRSHNYVRIELADAAHYEKLIREGLNFFGICKFEALPAVNSECINDDWCEILTNPSSEASQQGRGAAQGDLFQKSEKSLLQCYRCQGFWHIAAHCRHSPRCVRCGEAHSVEFCPRPRNNPTCCHCSGPHHAGFRNCPVRLQLLNSTPINMILSADRVLIGRGSNVSRSARSDEEGKVTVSPAE